MTNKLKPCPFCGGKVHIVVTDDEGNRRGELGSKSAKEYLKDTWSGLAFCLMHVEADCKTGFCPLANDDQIIGDQLYDTKEGAIEAWNTRIKDGE